MQGFWNKLFTIWCESYQIGDSHATSFCKTATDIASYLKSTHTHTHTNVTVQLIMTHIPTWHICDQHGSDICHSSLCDEAEQSDISVKGCINGVEGRIRCRGVTTIKTQTILLSNIPTVSHNSKHYSVQTTGSCNTPTFISSLLIELPIQSMETNTDFSPRIFMSYFAADIPWWCRSTGTIKCTWHIRQWNFSTAWYNRTWNTSS